MHACPVTCDVLDDALVDGYLMNACPVTGDVLDDALMDDV